MKILCLAIDCLPRPGGVAVFFHNLCLQLSKRGHQVDVLAPARKGSGVVDTAQPYTVYRYVSLRRLSSVAPIRRTVKLHQQNSYDLVFLGHFMTTHALGALVLRRFWGVPYVILSHGNDLRYSLSTSLDELVARWLLGNAALMLANSGFTAARIREVGYDGPIEVLNPGVNATLFHPGADTDEVCHKYALDGRPVLLTVARLVAKKNVDGVLRALPQVIERVGEVCYLIVGDGGQRGALETLCRELRLEPYVRFLGHVGRGDALQSLYCAADLFVMPSRSDDSDVETFGISYVEASACGLPVIAGRGGGTADAIVHGQTGLLVDPHDVSGLVAAIVRLLTSTELARRMGENGRRRVERELTWHRVGQRLDGYLRQVMDKTPEGSH